MRDNIETEDVKTGINHSEIDYANITMAYKIGVPEDLTEDAQRAAARQAAKDLFQYHFSDKPGLRSNITVEPAEPRLQHGIADWKVTVVAQKSNTTPPSPYENERE